MGSSGCPHGLGELGVDLVSLLGELGDVAQRVRVRLAEAEEKLRAAEDVSTRLEIVSPEDGTIIGQRVFTVGAVVRPGDPIMDLVPRRDRLIAEVNVQPNDIELVHPGLVAEK